MALLRNAAKRITRILETIKDMYRLDWTPVSTPSLPRTYVYRVKRTSPEVRAMSEIADASILEYPKKIIFL